MPTSQFVIYILTIALSPLIAVQVTELLQRRHAARQRRHWVFHTLMGTRGARLAFEHVKALNMIDLEFRGNDRASRQVLEAWKTYLAHLKTISLSSEVWIPRADDLFFDLLHSMAGVVGYPGEKTEIRATSYTPVAHSELEDDQGHIRRGIVELLTGKRALPVVLHGGDSQGERLAPPTGSARD